MPRQDSDCHGVVTGSVVMGCFRVTCHECGTVRYYDEDEVPEGAEEGRVACPRGDDASPRAVVSRRDDVSLDAGAEPESPPGRARAGQLLLFPAAPAARRGDVAMLRLLALAAVVVLLCGVLVAHHGDLLATGESLLRTALVGAHAIARFFATARKAGHEAHGPARSPAHLSHKTPATAAGTGR